LKKNVLRTILQEGRSSLATRLWSPWPFFTEVALKNGVQPRCEIQTPEAAQYYIDLGVRHFCLGDQLGYLLNCWNEDGGKLKEKIAQL
jgi:hypothetical protein